MIAQAQAAEAAGFELVTVMDHFYQIRGVGPEDDPMLEAYSALAGIAVSTKKVRLGTLVTGVTYRNPAMLAKMVTTLDVISGGRAILGHRRGLERIRAQRPTASTSRRSAAGWIAWARRSRSAS